VTYWTQLLRDKLRHARENGHPDSMILQVVEKISGTLRQSSGRTERLKLLGDFPFMLSVVEAFLGFFGRAVIFQKLSNGISLASGDGLIVKR
jgi:hypothetical protein